MKKLLLSAACVALFSAASGATVHKESCDGEDTGYKTLNKACANNPSTVLVNCINICTHFDFRTAKCTDWTTKEIATAVCTSSGDKMLVRKCTDEQTEFAAQALETAREQAQTLSDALHAMDLSELEVETQRRFGYAKMIAKGALNWVNHDRQFLCKMEDDGMCKGNAAAAIPLTGGLVAIRLCAPFFNYSAKSAGSVIIHEATHSCCGTTDLEYYNSGDADQPLSTQHWPVIADTYTYWIMHGLCVPGETECSADAVAIPSAGAGAGAGGGGGGAW